MSGKYLGTTGVALVSLLATSGMASAETLDCTFTDYHDPFYSQAFVKKMAPARQRHIIKGNVVHAGTLTGKVTQNTKSRLKWVINWSDIKADGGITFYYKFTFIRKTGMILLHIDSEGDFVPIERIAGTCTSRS